MRDQGTRVEPDDSDLRSEASLILARGDIETFRRNAVKLVERVKQYPGWWRS